MKECGCYESKWKEAPKCGYKDHCMDDGDCHMAIPKMKCRPERECVRTYKCYYKLYRVSHYRLYKVCPHCGAEFDYHYHRGMCPRCG